MLLKKLNVLFLWTQNHFARGEGKQKVERFNLETFLKQRERIMLYNFEFSYKEKFNIR